MVEARVQIASTLLVPLFCGRQVYQDVRPVAGASHKNLLDAASNEEQHQYQFQGRGSSHRSPLPLVS